MVGSFDAHRCIRLIDRRTLPPMFPTIGPACVRPPNLLPPSSAYASSSGGGSGTSAAAPYDMSEKEEAEFRQFIAALGQNRGQFAAAAPAPPPNTAISATTTAASSSS